MGNAQTTDYVVYYDEIKPPGYWHGVFFVPANRIGYFGTLLMEARGNIRYPDPVHFINLKKDRTDGGLFPLAKSFVSLGMASLQQQKFSNNPSGAVVGRDVKNIGQIKAKLAISHIAENTMRDSTSRGKLIERTLKTAIKSPAHYLFPKDFPIRITRIIFEGGGSQGIDDQAIIQSLKNETRDHISIIPNEFEFIPSDHRNVPETQGLDAHILQCVDALLGCVRHSCTHENAQNSRDIVASPVRSFLDEYQTAPMKRLANSRYFQGFSISEAKLINNEWHFDKIKAAKTTVPDLQKPLL